MNMEELLKLIKERSGRRLGRPEDESATNEPAESPREIKDIGRPQAPPKVDNLNAPFTRREIADIALLCAIDDSEGHKLRECFSPSWTTEGREGVLYRVTTCQLGVINAKVVMASQNDMGMVPA